ncbi:MAG: response regulator transcription factor [Opitutus sp.]
MIRIVMIEDQRMVQQSVFASIAERLPVKLMGAFCSGRAALGDVRSLRTADIGLLDLNLGDEQAFDFLPSLKEVAPNLKLIWLTSVSTEYLLSLALQANLEGFVHKTEPIEVLITAIERVAAGGRFVSGAVAEMNARFRVDANHFSKLLSDREQELLRLLGKGLSNSEAAALLGISASTVQTHRRNLMSRLGLHNATELQSYALQRGFAVPERLHVRR